MSKDKKSLLGWLTGGAGADDDFSFDDLESGAFVPPNAKKIPITSLDKRAAPAPVEQEEPVDTDGELPVDVSETPTHVIIKAMIAGVKPEDLDVSITRDMVTIRGKREHHVESNTEKYSFQELYWGSFARTVVLPQEIEIEEAEANTKHGLLTISLPKINKNRQTKLKVKSI